MSISRAPSPTAYRISARRCGRGVRPAGNPVATEATGMPEPCRALTAAATMVGYTQTAPTVGGASARPSASTMSSLTGRRAFAARRRTRPGVSSPASVVRSMHRMAFRRKAAWYSFFTVLRAGKEAALRSVAERLTATPSNHSGRRRVPLFRAWLTPSATARLEPFGTTLRTEMAGLACAFSNFISAGVLLSVLSMICLPREVEWRFVTGN